VDGDRAPLFEHDRRPAAVVGDSRLQELSAEDADVHLVRAAEEHRPLDHPRQPVVPPGAVRLELDAFGADHRLDAAPHAGGALFGPKGPIADGEPARGAVPLCRRVEQVRDAEEVRDERGARLLVDLARRRRLLDAAVVHHRDAVAHGEGLLLVVRDEDEGDADVVLDRLQLDLQFLAEPRVQGAQGLVEEQDARLEHERTRERDALLLPTGELRGPAVLEALQANELEDPAHLALPFLLVEPLVLEPEGHVCCDVEVGEERVALKHRVDVPLVRRDLRHVCAVQDDATARRLLEARDHPERRRLAAARRPEQGEELGRRHVQVDGVDRDDVVEPLRQLLQLDLALH